jgi:predicted GIY-YIG superfamily endonuclease
MELPLIVGPMKKGLERLSSLSAVKRPDFGQLRGPTCARCGTSLSDEITDVMDVMGVKKCPVCVLEDVHPLANPQRLENVASMDDVRSIVLDTYGKPPEQSTTEDMPFPGVYILWAPPREEYLQNYLDASNKLGKLFTTLLNAGSGNGLLYVGESTDVTQRVWQHLQGRGTLITTLMLPTQLVAINWKPPDVDLRSLEERVGRQVARSVEQKGYDLEVYWN